MEAQPHRNQQNPHSPGGMELSLAEQQQRPFPQTHPPGPPSHGRRLKEPFKPYRTLPWSYPPPSCLLRTAYRLAGWMPGCMAVVMGGKEHLPWFPEQTWQSQAWRTGRDEARMTHALGFAGVGILGRR